jgi:ABC-type dipeptide/oligopeptide/nickel transport system permease component
MIHYLLKRIGAGLLTVFFIASATFAAMHFVPGDPLMGNKATTPEIRENLKRKYGLDRPVSEQYAKYLLNMTRGDFGISFTQQNRSVNDIIAKHFPVSASLGVLALLFAASGGILLGSLAALKRGRTLDRALMLAVILGISIPSFAVAALVQLGAGAFNEWIESSVIPLGGWGSWDQMILPALVLGLGTLAFLTRLKRSALLEIVHQDYIRTAKAKGLSPQRIFFGHQLRNSILPVITYLGPSIATITTGGFVVEQVFSIPGLGKYFVQAIQQLDYTVIMGLTVFYGSFLVFMVIVVDLVYGLVDPRISLTQGKRS